MNYTFHIPVEYQPQPSDFVGLFIGLGIGLVLLLILLGIGLYIYSSIALGKIFKKAGREFWAAWIPFFNVWRLLEMGGFNGALVLLTLIPGVGAITVAILSIVAQYRIGLKFGKSDTFVLLAIFLQPVWLGILAFDKSKWKESLPK